MELDDYKIIKAVTFVPKTHEPTNAKIRVRPVEGQGLSPDLRVECPRNIREQYPVGTIFKMKTKMCQREDGSYFLYNHHSWKMEKIS